jgi:hypothetical protein
VGGATFARLCEHHRALFRERLAEQDSVAAPLGDEPRERLPPLLQWTLAQIVPAETQKVEGHERGLRPAALGQERAEVAAPVVHEDDGLAVDHRLIHVEAANRFSDPLKTP